MIVRGRVQGVYFRDSTRRLAREHDLAGWVANRGDGSVEAVFEGEEGSVEALVAFCRHGPERAAVSSVEVMSETPQGERGFRIT